LQQGAVMSERLTLTETTSLGVTYLAGLQTGVYESTAQLAKRSSL